MRAQHTLLALCVRGLAMKWRSLEPQQQRMPMNQEDNFQSHQRVLDGEPQQVSVVQSCLFPGQGADENFFITCVIIDFDIQSFAGYLQLEIETQIQRGKRRDIKMLGDNFLEYAMRRKLVLA
jgi:hypothetical protein